MSDTRISNSILKINMGALAQNYQAIQNHVKKNCAVASVVKANAYGLGVKEISTALNKLNCPQFFVGNLNEAIEIRTWDKDTPIATFDGLTRGDEETFINYNILPVLNTPDEINRWAETAKKKNKKLPAILHFDTGMNRLGLSEAQTKILLDKKNYLDGLDVQLVMSHFACADEKDHPMMDNQHTQFQQIITHFPKAKKSLCNSSGLYRNNAFHYDLVRPGYALYGGNPTPEQINPMKKVISLDARILQIRDCLKNDSIGYNSTYRFKQNTRTATVAIGYADGFHIGNSSKAKLYYNNHPCPVIGRVSMDLVTIDISNIPGRQPQEGDMVEVIGPNQSIEALAKNSQTIGYEILTALGRRYKREYI